MFETVCGIPMETVLVDAICGTSGPSEKLRQLYQNRGLGSWVGGFQDRWFWYHVGFEGIDLSELCAIYQQMKHTEISFGK
jgi:hypothetical protein